MLRTMLKSKIHRATVTEANLYYEGSITIDADLISAADILEHEDVLTAARRLWKRKTDGLQGFRQLDATRTGSAVHHANGLYHQAAQ